MENNSPFHRATTSMSQARLCSVMPDAGAAYSAGRGRRNADVASQQRVQQTVKYASYHQCPHASVLAYRLYRQKSAHTIDPEQRYPRHDVGYSRHKSLSLRMMA